MMLKRLTLLLVITASLAMGLEIVTLDVDIQNAEVQAVQAVQEYEEENKRMTAEGIFSISVFDHVIGVVLTLALSKASVKF